MTHGYSGYTNHGCRCEVCRSAQKAYMREYRKTNKRYRLENRARLRAQLRLARLHPEEFRRLHDLEREAEGLPPIGSSPLGRPPKKVAA